MGRLVGGGVRLGAVESGWLVVGGRARDGAVGWLVALEGGRHLVRSWAASPRGVALEHVQAA